MTTAHLRYAVASALVLFAGIELWFRSYVPDHYLATQTIERALAAGGGCVVLVGDSRMQAAVARDVLEAELARRGSNDCIADLAIGAATLPAQVAALRHYFERLPGKPQLIVIGVGPETVLADPEPPDPESFVGNRAIVLGLAEPGDVSSLYPGFPLRHFDPGFRFLVGSSSALTAYRSLAWAKVQALQDRLTGVEAEARNRFGALSDMRALSEAMQGDLQRKLPQPGKPIEVNATFLRLLELPHRKATPVLTVELPVASNLRSGLGPHAADLERVIAERTRSAGGRYRPERDSERLDDALFEDGVHLGRTGAERFSRKLAGAIAETLD